MLELATLCIHVCLFVNVQACFHVWSVSESMWLSACCDACSWAVCVQRTLVLWSCLVCVRRGRCILGESFYAGGRPTRSALLLWPTRSLDALSPAQNSCQELPSVPGCPSPGGSRGCGYKQQSPWFGAGRLHGGGRKPGLGGGLREDRCQLPESGG